MPCSETEWSAQCLSLFIFFLSLPNHILKTLFVVCLFEGGTVPNILNIWSCCHILMWKTLLSFLPFVHLKKWDMCRKSMMNWCADDIPMVGKSLRLRRIEMNVFTVLHESVKHSHWSTNGFTWVFTSPNVCEGNIKCRDWHSRETRPCDSSILKRFNLLILTFVTCVCVFAQFCFSYTYDLNQMRSSISGSRNNESVCTADIEGLKYAETQCNIFKKGIYIIVIVYCTVPWNWPCQLYMYRYSF